MRIILEGTPLLENEIVLDEVCIQFVGLKGVDSPPCDESIQSMIRMLNQMISSRN